MSAALLILDEIEIRLKGINRHNGDIFTMQKVQRAKLTPFIDGDLPAVNYWPTQDVIESRQYQTETHDLSITIEAYDKTRDRPFTDVSIELYTGIVAALFRDVNGNDSPSLGGMVQSLQIEAMQTVIGEGQAPWCGAIIELTIRYRTALGKTELL